MAVKVNIPTMLRTLAGGNASVAIDGLTMSEVLDNLEVQCSGIKERLVDDQGRVRRFINVYLDGEDIRYLSDLDTKVGDAKEVSIVPAVAGG
ncbi:MAG: MoaD/ThiS family protein [Planctomycetota bacterium]|nr:MoaD/ThiS family protein [Planctomycetota bacterium]MDA1140762.1 MoaD/ThiS family protein [Planctomycetota bacterium]